MNQPYQRTQLPPRPPNHNPVLVSHPTQPEGLFGLAAKLGRHIRACCIIVGWLVCAVVFLLFAVLTLRLAWWLFEEACRALGV